ncbi:YaaR family protein [Lentibacillus saliphilus]|uniref:YaaR family protein n=1 Tax=Lentibacillus saliphilus TaxID=2737028 RepID=UPI001C2F9C65|nr:YaaR family protein [Lentibacillus saliphilus]
MKINQDMVSKLDATPTKHPRSTEGKSAFDQLVRSSTTHIRQQEIEQLMKNITVQGDRLARFRSFKDLAKFKVMVREFLKKTVDNGLELKQDHSFNLNGNSQKLAIVKEIDEKLIALTEDLMSQEKKTVDLLGMIGEIKGLLINLAA